MKAGGMSKRRPQVIMVGTDMSAKGGVSSVICLYREAGLLDESQVLFLASYVDGNAIQKLSFYLRFLVRYVGTLIGCSSVRVVHIHTSSYGSFFRKCGVVWLGRLFRKKVIVHMHGAGFNVFYRKMPSLLRHFIRLTLCAADVLVALSSQWKADLFYISEHPDIRVIYNPTVLREPVFEHDPEAEQTQPVNFLFMGRLGQRKGVYDIIESARHLRGENVQINLYGDGELENVKSKVAAAGVERQVAVCGWIDGSRKDATFRSANVLLLPSYHEGLPISVLEAMAYGLPVLATDVGGISEAVHDGVNGYLIQPGQCEELAERIEWLASSSSLRKEMGQAGYRMAAEKFALPVIKRQLEGLYEELVNR